MADTVKMFLVPGSIPFLGLGLVLGIGLLYGPKRAQRWGRTWLTVLLVLYGFLSTPFGSDLVVGPLVSHFGSITTREQVPGVTTVVVLSTGSEVYRAYGQEVAELGKASAYNALEGARIYRLLGSPAVIASGGIVNPGERTSTEAQILAEGLVRLGVPRERITIEGGSRTTREQAVFVSKILRERGVRRFVLVTAADHMPRAIASFEEQGVDPIASVAVFAVPTPPGLRNRLRPSLNALRQSDWACYEYLARVYYWSQGWAGAQ